MKAKQIHLDEKVIEILTIKAVKEKTTFKELVQKILTDKSKDYDKGLDWVFYKNENWNVYKTDYKNNIILLHPENDNGISNGSLLEISIKDFVNN